jgi:hypothetical protein
MTKYIYVRYHFILDIMSQGVVLVKKIATDDNHADILMKPNFTFKFKYCFNLFELCNTWEVIKDKFIFCELPQFKTKWRFVEFILNYRPM